MKTLHFYLTRQVLLTLFMTVVVFTFVLLLGNILREILALLLGGQVSFLMVAEAIGLLIPYVLVFALPMGMLTATLLVFGRFSADHELTAVRASGISLLTLTSPLLVLSLVLSGLCAWINLQLAPLSREAYKNLILRVSQVNPSDLLRENQYVTLPANDKSEGDYMIYVGKIKGNELSDITLHQMMGTNGQRWMKAASGRVLHDPKSQESTLVLYDTYGGSREGLTVHSLGTTEKFEISLNRKGINLNRSPKLSDMTFSQLQDKLREVENFGLTNISLDNLSSDQLRREMRKYDQAKGDLAMPVKVQIHRQISFSFACLAFTLVGIPLGIRAHRRETSIGVALSLLLVLVYYSFFILGQSLESRAELFPHLLLWIPNFLFQALGGVLLWRANKGV